MDFARNPSVADLDGSAGLLAKSTTPCGQLMLILGPRKDMALYHLARDPHEDTNLASEHPEKVQHLLSLLQKEALAE